MKGPENLGGADVSRVLGRHTQTKVPALPLTEVQKLAAERRAAAEDLLAEARDFEQRVAALAGVAEAAIAAEQDAAESLRRAREQLAAVVAAESDAQAEVNVAAGLLREAQDARKQTDAQLSALRIAGDSGPNGLSAEATSRVIERRIADAQRHGARPGAT
jgi:hypothetical protein